MHPLWILAIGTLITVLGIVRLRIGAFFALMLAALVVSFLAPGELADKVPRVIAALGLAAGKLALIIASAAVIGQCMTDSGAADRIVRAFLRLFGERRTPAALMTSGFVLSVPVFFDTVFYLLVPLARASRIRTGKNADPRTARGGGGVVRRCRGDDADGVARRLALLAARTGHRAPHAGAL